MARQADALDEPPQGLNLHGQSRVYLNASLSVSEFLLPRPGSARTVLAQLLMVASALLQFGGGVAVASIEARAIQDGTMDRAVTHVEEAGVRHAWAHDDRCVLCQQVADTRSSPPPSPTLAVGIATTAPAIWPSSAQLPLLRTVATQRSRAPPTV
ncbi:MAG: hypothetical protein K2X99_07975 [Gemmatimonadaceae bacterium]|nr:hypothetical protein [Gemmatimonadaceae bacterium]